jgi:hypothetical protein
MRSALTIDEDLVHRLPLPLARLYRRAHNAKSPLERHLTAYYLWEAGLKLLGSVAIVEYAERPEHDPQLAERLHNLARPAVGHWWEFVRLLVPLLAGAGDWPFAAARELVLGRTRDDLPHAAGLDAALCEALDGRGGSRSTVRLSELFDRLVRYRNRELGHGASGQRPNGFYERMGHALLVGVAEVFGRLDACAGRRLLHVADVRRQPSGAWLVEMYELAGETARRAEPLELPASEMARLPCPGRVYMAADGSDPPAFRALHPLLVYDPAEDEVLYLSARRGRQRAEYLCYSSGRVVDREELAGEQRALLARVLDIPVDGGTAAAWAARSQAEEQATAPAAEEAAPARYLGEFELLSTLGRGGMGVVYRAWQPSLGRQVALKCLLRSGDRRAGARFAREIRALGRVEHPNLVKIFTSGSTGEQWFYAMELLEGATLAAVCDKLQTRGPSAATLDLHTWEESLSTACQESRRAEQRLDSADAAPANEPAAPPRTPPAEQAPPALTGRGYLGRVIELLRQVAEAAHALNEAGVVHRDIKPGNVVVTPDATHAVLMDLGLAQIGDEADGRLTRTRQFVGTLR